MEKQIFESIDQLAMVWKVLNPLPIIGYTGNRVFDSNELRKAYR